MTSNALPITYYDVVTKHQWPRFRHAIQADLTRLRETGVPGPIDTVDSFNSAMLEAARVDVRGFAAEVAGRLGVGTEVALSMLAQHQPGQLEAFMATYNFAYHSVLNFELAGRKTFFVRDGLVERLMATQIASDSDLVRLPFKACQFVFTSPAAVQALALFASPVGAPVALNYEMPISVLATEFDSPEHQGRSLVLLIVQASPSGTGAMMKRQLLLAPGRSLEAALRTDWTTVRERDGVADETVGKMLSNYGAEVVEVTDQPFYTDGLLIVRLVLNAILYLSSDSAEVAEQVGRQGSPTRGMNRAARRTAARESPLPYSTVGDSVRPIYVDPAVRGRREGVPVSLGLQTLQHRLLVRGHWKNQAHGPQHAERKLIWVEPYLRGPDVAEIVNRPYVVQ